MPRVVQIASTYKKPLILWSENLCIDKTHTHTLHNTSLKTHTSLLYLETRGGGDAVEQNREGLRNWREKDGNRIRKQGDATKREGEIEIKRDVERRNQQERKRGQDINGKQERGVITEIKGREKKEIAAGSCLLERGVGCHSTKRFKHQWTPF